MRIFRALLTAAVVLLVAAASAGAAEQGWREGRAPDGGAVTSVAIGADGTIYAGTYNGLFVNRGGDWQRSTLPGLAETAEILSVTAASPKAAYVSALDDEENNYLFKTTDAGASWHKATTGIESDYWIYKVAVVSGAGNVAYAISDENVYRTADGGGTWKPTAAVRDSEAPAQQHDGVGSVATDPVSPSTIYIGGYRGIYTSADSGATWTKTGVGFPSNASIIALAVEPTTPRTMYAGTAGNGVYKSVDGGLTWHAARTGLPMADAKNYASVNDLALDPVDPDRVSAATSRGEATSVDGGKSWRMANGADLAAMSSLAIDPRSSQTLVAGSYDRGVLRSDDRGASWRQDNAGLTAIAPLAMAVDRSASSAVYMGTYGNGLVATADSGATWTPAVGAPSQTVSAIAVGPKPKTLYVGTPYDGVLQSRDVGKTWVSAGRVTTAEIPAARSLSSDIRALAIDPRHPSVLYAAAKYNYGAAVYRTANAGESWRRVFETGKSSDSSLEALAVDPTHPATIYAGSGAWTSHMSVRDWGVFVTRDAGAHWERVVAGLQYGKQRPGINALAVSPKTRDVYATTNVGVYRLKRGAGRWTRIATGMPRVGKSPAWAWPIAVNPRTGAVVVGTQLGLYELARPGSLLRWRSATPLLEGRGVLAVAVSADGKRLYAATPGHFFRSG